MLVYNEIQSVTFGIFQKLINYQTQFYLYIKSAKHFSTNKTQYDWFPGKSQNSKKFHTKNQEDSQLRLEVICQILSKQSIFAKKWPNFHLKWPNFRKSEFSRHIEYDFLKEDHKNNFHTINQENSQPRLKVIGQELSKLSILAKNGLKWTKFCHIRIFPVYRV